MEGLEDGYCGHVLRQAVPVDYGVWEIRVLPVVFCGHIVFGRRVDGSQWDLLTVA